MPGDPTKLTFDDIDDPPFHTNAGGGPQTLNIYTNVWKEEDRAMLKELLTGNTIPNIAIIKE